MSFRSQSIADVSVDASFTPEKITLLHKNAEIRLQLCFRARFRPPGQSSRVGEWSRNHLGGARFAHGASVRSRAHTLSLQTTRNRGFTFGRSDRRTARRRRLSRGLPPSPPEGDTERHRAVLSVTQTLPPVPFRCPAPTAPTPPWAPVTVHAVCNRSACRPGVVSVELFTTGTKCHSCS